MLLFTPIGAQSCKSVGFCAYTSKNLLHDESRRGVRLEGDLAVLEKKQDQKIFFWATWISGRARAFSSVRLFFPAAPDDLFLGGLDFFAGRKIFF